MLVLRAWDVHQHEGERIVHGLPGGEDVESQCDVLRVKLMGRIPE